MMNYFKDIPYSANEWGIAKVLMVRKLAIHIKHIFTEIFVRKTVDIQPTLDLLGMTLFDYMEHMTNRTRRIYRIPRDVIADPHDILSHDFQSFFPSVELVNQLKSTIALDFDGVVTNNYFRQWLYPLCLDRCNAIICSANPTVGLDYFTKKQVKPPNRILPGRGKIAKLNNLLTLSKTQDVTFFVDNEVEYLRHAWIFGVYTYHYHNKRITHHTMNTK